MKVAVLDDYAGQALRLADWSPVLGRCVVHAFERNLGVPDEAAEVLADYDVICLMRERMAVPAALIARLPKLRFIAATGTFNRSLDLEAATARGIPVSISASGEAGLHAAPEMTWALLMALARNVPMEDRSLRAGHWQRTVGTGLHGKTLGLLGLGKVGQVVARYGRAFGMEVLAWSANLTAERAAAAGAALVAKDELLRRADVVSIHLVLSDRTRGLVGAAELGLMKPTALLVNTARGAILDEAALIEALGAGRIAGAALDVYDREPLPPDHPLLRLPNTVLTPHLGFGTAEVYAALYTRTVENVVAFLDGRPIRLMNPDVSIAARKGS